MNSFICQYDGEFIIWDAKHRSYITLSLRYAGRDLRTICCRIDAQ